MKYKKRGFQFEWDPNKETSNIEKHGLDFKEAADILLDEYFTVIDLRKEDNGEIRHKGIGMISGRLWALIYTRRNGRYRIISARKAKRNERRKYSGLQS